MNGPSFIIKEQLQPRIFSNSLSFAGEELQQGCIVVTNYDTSLVSGMYVFKVVCYLTI